MSSRLTRPPYVLVHNADQSGCGWHRLLYPLQTLSRLGLMHGRADMQIWSDDMLQLMDPDIVIWQRQNEPHQIETMERYKKALPKACMVYELDDALWAVPAWSFHRPYIPHDIEQRIQAATQFCDVITVSTRTLAQEMRRICGDRIPVRVAPNMLSRPSFQQAMNVRLANSRPHRKMRVGWGGGISHTGDLRIIAPVIEHFGDRIEWVFLGMKPEGVKTTIEFHDGVQPAQYLPALAALDLDLMLAPLEDNLFNRCKSNLRLLEAGACRYPVIASPVDTYTDGNPPIRYAEDTASWITEIEQMLALDLEGRAHYGTSLNAWAERGYCLDDRAEERAGFWLPGATKSFVPSRKTRAAGVTLLSSRPSPELAALADIDTTLDRACARTGHVIFVAPGTHVTKAMIDRLVAHLEPENVACATALSNDGGIVGFPSLWRYVPIDAVLGDKLDALCVEEMAGRTAALPFATGSLIALSKHALDEIGRPRSCAPGEELSSIVEWSMMAVTRGKRVIAALNVYASVNGQPALVDMERLLRRGQLRYPPPNLPMDPLAETRAHLELAFHRAHYRTAVPNQKAGYAEWAAYFDEIGAADEDAMRRKAQERKTPRFCVAKAMEESGFDIEPQTWLEWIGCGEPSVRRLENAAPGVDWYVFARKGVTIRRHALFLLADKIDGDSGLRVIYGDHDWITNGQRGEHDMKPEFDHDMLVGRDYMTPIFAVRADVLAECENHDLDDVGLYALALDAVRHAPRQAIGHIPRILAHLRGFDVAKENRLAERKRAIVRDHLERMGWGGTVEPHRQHPRFSKVTFAATEKPSVTIIIPTKDRRDMLEPCLASLLARTSYPNFDILIVDNGSTSEDHKRYLDEMARQDRITLLPWDHPYNWSALNNYAAAFAKGDLLLFLNDDTRFVEDGWLDAMVGAALRTGIGAVGARLLYPIGHVQHVGVVSHHGMTGHIQKGLPHDQPGYNGYAIVGHEATAVTGACLLVRKDLFKAAGEFNTELAHNFNDVAFCQKLRAMGYINVVATAAQVQHIEGATRPNNLKDRESHDRIAAEGRILQRLFPEPDPYWNPNMLLAHYDGGIMVSGMSLDTFVWPGPAWPWRGEDWPHEGVLLIGDDGTNLRREMIEGSAVYVARIDGFQLKIHHPPLANVAPWDIRYPVLARQHLARLGIERIILRSIIGCPPEILGFLTRLGIKVIYRPATGECVCPWTNFAPAGADCGQGWKKDACAQCIAEKGSPFGHISLAGWIDQWHEFLEKVVVDERDLSDVARGAMRDVYATAAGAGVPAVEAL